MERRELAPLLSSWKGEQPSGVNPGAFFFLSLLPQPRRRNVIKLFSCKRKENIVLAAVPGSVFFFSLPGGQTGLAQQQRLHIVCRV
jgi:hypothetical protein